MLGAWVVSHLALIIGMLHHALGHEFEPWWRQTLFRTQAQHRRFLHDSIWFIWLDTIIWLSNLSCELWNRKLKTKEIYFKKIIKKSETVNGVRKYCHYVVFKLSNDSLVLRSLEVTVIISFVSFVPWASLSYSPYSIDELLIKIKEIWSKFHNNILCSVVMLCWINTVWWV